MAFLKLRVRIQKMLAVVVLSPAFVSIQKACAAWSGTDEEFIHMVESNNWAYFRYNQAGPYRLFRGAGRHNEQYSYDPLATCAGDGFGMAALVIGAYRGWSSDEYAYTNILCILRAYESVLERDTNNFFRHFYQIDTGSPASGSEISPIDSSWFICGALLAAQYFRGTEIDAIANHIFDRMNYRSAGPFWGMYFEYTIINILGSGSTNGWDPATARASWESCTRATPAYMEGPLFWYQWPQAFVDFRFRRDSLGSNHFDIARNAFLRQRQKCIALRNANPTNYPDFGTNGWGLTSAMASLGYLELRPFAGFCTANPNYGTQTIYCTTPPATNDVNTDEEACDSGTLVPVCLPSCMSHVPYEARNAMKHIYNAYEHLGIFDRYGFANAVNTGTAKSGYSFFWSDNAAMDYGCNVVVLENFRSGMPWKYFMAHPRVAAGLSNCGFDTPYIAYHDDWNDGSDPNVWTGMTTYANLDGSNPTATYAAISWYNTWVNGYARQLMANGSGDVVRFQLKETDQSKKDLLSFWLRGTTGSERFEVGLRDAENHETLVSITNYVTGGVVPTNWTRIRIPLRRFAVTGNPNNDVRLIFLGDFTVRFLQAGEIYIEDLAFVDDDLAPAPPDRFGAACVDGRVRLRWGYSPDDDVVGYHLWRRPDASAGFVRANTNLISALHEWTDVSVESQWDEDFYYAVQCVDRSQNAGLFSFGPFEQRVWIGRRRDVDYGDGVNPNTFGGDHGRWGPSWGDVRFLQTNGWDGRLKWVRRAEGDSNCGVYITLNNGDIGPYEALAFWMRQNWGAEDFEVGLKSTNAVEIKAPITRYAPVTNSWVYVIVPLIDFRGVDFQHMDNISFTFRKPGSVFLDEIRFVRLERETQRRFVLEAEKPTGFVGGNTNDWKPAASQSYVLGQGWGLGSGDAVWFSLTTTGEWNEAILDVRYACNVSAGRTLQVWVDDVPRTNLTIAFTGGWGEESSHFREASVSLGRITNAGFTLKLGVTNAGAAVNLDRLILRTTGCWFREAERPDAQSGSGGFDYKPGASGGEVLGASWGGTLGDFAVYSNITISAAISNAWLHVRYGQRHGTGPVLRVRLDGLDAGRLVLARTEGWLDTWAEGGMAHLPLGNVPAGVHTLRIEAIQNSQDVNLDWLSIAEGPAFGFGWDSDRDGLPDYQEARLGTSPFRADSDSDGLDDLFEISRLGGFVTDPLVADTDADGQTDGEEWLAGTNPLDADSLFEFLPFEPMLYSGRYVWVTWAGTTGRNYDVSYSDGAPSNGAVFISISNSSSIVYSNGFLRYLDDGSGTGTAPDDPALRQRTYRVRAFRP